MKWVHVFTLRLSMASQTALAIPPVKTDQSDRTRKVTALLLRRVVTYSLLRSSKPFVKASPYTAPNGTLGIYCIEPAVEDDGGDEWCAGKKLKHQATPASLCLSLSLSLFSSTHHCHVVGAARERRRVQDVPIIHCALRARPCGFFAKRQLVYKSRSIRHWAIYGWFIHLYLSTADALRPLAVAYGERIHWHITGANCRVALA